MQQQFNHDVFKAEQDLAEEARGGVNMTRVEALRLKMQRWQTTYERQQGAPPSDQDTAASQVYQRLVAQLGNAVDDWAAAADVEQGAQAALHVVQQARAEAAEVTASTAARASARAVTGAWRRGQLHSHVEEPPG